jgi:hypothetical protein
MKKLFRRLTVFLMGLVMALSLLPAATLTVSAVSDPTISISDASVAEGDTGTVSLTFNVTLSAASGTVITVDYTTADGTAMAGSDISPQAAHLRSRRARPQKRSA